MSLVLYDVTTLYFEAEKEADLCKVGYSKERRVDPQIVVGLLVDRTGFPLEIGCYESNKAEMQTIVPIVKQFEERHGLADMSSSPMPRCCPRRPEGDRRSRTEVHRRFQGHQGPIDLASHFRWHADAFTDAQLIDTITPKNSCVIENDDKLKTEPVWDPEQRLASWRVVWAYSQRRAVRDNRTLTLQENRAKDLVARGQDRQGPAVREEHQRHQHARRGLAARARRLVGLKSYVTKVPIDLMGPGEAIASYHDLWRVERSFRMSKPTCAPGPWTPAPRRDRGPPDHRVHRARGIARAQVRSGLAIRNLVRQLRPLRSATILSNGVEQTLAPVIPGEQQDLLDAITGRNLRH